MVTSAGDVVLLTVAGDYMHSRHYMPWINDMRMMHSIGRADEVSAVLRDYKAVRVGYDQLGFEDRTIAGDRVEGGRAGSTSERRSPMRER